MTYHPAQLTDPDTIREFLFAGNARVTLVSRKTGTRYTYQVRRPIRYDGETSVVTHFVNVLTGPDEYRYLGHYYEGDSDERRRYTHGRKSQIDRDAPSAKAWAWFDSHLAADQIPETLEVWHEGRCGRCGRALTVPESITRGMGPMCAGRL